MDIRPLGDKVVVEVIEEEKTASGIVLPDVAKDKPQRARVVAVGRGRWLDNGQRQPVEVSVGDLVLFDTGAGTRVKVEDRQLLVLAERDIVAVLATQPVSV
ncbi:MAG: co-chaperone GroES [Firmicutes bacterium]|nr:co-chaperone GroES [Bacillota bacterium]